MAIFSASGDAATVGGIISSDTYWSAANSPYIATSSVLVDGGAKLTIDPGVEIRFAPSTGLVVLNGTLTAQGTSQLPITFKPNQTGTLNGWNGVRFGDFTSDAVFQGESYVSGSIIESAIIEGVREHYNGAIRVESSAPFIHRTEIRNNLTSGIGAVDADGLRITDNTIHHNLIDLSWGGGIAVRDSNSIQISRNQINDNTALTGGGMVMVNCDDALINDNTFQRNAARDGGAGFVDKNSTGIDFFRNVLVENANFPGEFADRLCGAADFTGSSNVQLEGNTVQGTNSVAAMVIEDVTGLTMKGDRIVNNLKHGLYFNKGTTNAVVSASASEPTIVAGNGGYQILNNQPFAVTTDPQGKGNVNARDVLWETNDLTAVQMGVFDFFDDSNKGIVFLEPIKSLADFDGDFDVDNQDLTDPAAGWMARFGVNLDGDDFLRWQRDYGFSASAIDAGVAIPEPGSALLLATGVAMSIVLSAAGKNR